MSSRLEYLIRKLDELDDAIRREKREYDKARDRYDKMRSRDILEDLRGQFLGYQTERDQLHSARSAAREKCLFFSLPLPNHHPKAASSFMTYLIADPRQMFSVRQNQPPPQQERHRPHSYTAPPPNTQRGQREAPPRPQYKTTLPHRPAPQHRDACPPRKSYGSNSSAAGQTRDQPGNNSNRTKRPAPPRPHQRTQTLDYEVEEPDGKSYVVRGGAVFRDFDPARDTVRRAE
ncbi:hypothetical protein INS49_012024 [Diaporthe citri]|uniref:uncharacterized protein n=1 Tax=Diaporthe citri TaxID=83186 RepID=UPI001C7F2A09|nr:uncharacterized protein INS49_012024 [Diaporthe citri]KAG6360956.1 hypothetical protein INS49_012024 [Diaporthe citri]